MNHGQLPIGREPNVRLDALDSSFSGSEVRVARVFCGAIEAEDVSSRSIGL